MSAAAFDDPMTSDSLGFSQTTRKDPLVVHWFIEPNGRQAAKGNDSSRENRPSWKITVHLEAPSDWKLAAASSGTAVIERISPKPLKLLFEFAGSFPPLGPGPSLDTQWKTPGGPVFFRLDPEMTLSAITEIPPPEPAGAPRSALAGAIPWLLLLIALFMLVVRFLLQKSSLKSLARKWLQTMPASQAPWPEWEAWLAGVERNWKDRTAQGSTAFPPEWIEMGGILPLARFGRPQNSAWLGVMGKIKILGRLDNLVKLDVVQCR